ncbi:hypothetical protein HPP92_018176 [Vanilla planifolia]|uniref:Electron transporter n=1 Tax=Vanilla planifolia TaxID=51239 RepID=A0A835UP94_VANPL|nr:hypothetical protein HPP92_018176 [Vanilla planifolia]
MDSKKLTSSRHKRSKSYTESKLGNDIMETPITYRNLKEDLEELKCHIDIKTRQTSTKLQGPWKQEIMQLEKRLKDQLVMRQVLEKALGYRTTSTLSANESFMPKPAKELIREIAVLELEVQHLEQYLLSLYRKAFDLQVPTLSPAPPKDRLMQPISCQRKLFDEIPTQANSSLRSPLIHSTRILPSQISAYNLDDESWTTERGVHRCHSALNQRAAYSSRISPSDEALARALQECHSQPLSFLTDGLRTGSGVTSLAEYLGTSIADHVPETPSKISEEMVRCMGAIYSKLIEPPMANHEPASSPTSSFSSMSAISPRFIGDPWSPGCRNESILDTRLINPFRVEGLKEFSGPYNAMVEVSSINRDLQKTHFVEHLLQTYESLVLKLATVSVRKMRNDEKMAFWINVHNALIMRAYLVHGVPQSSMKRASLLIKATCMIGGHCINADMIQGSFLVCRTHCSGQWLRTFMLPLIKLKPRDEWTRVYAIERQEPLLHFALCSGCHSDPAVRIYTAKRLQQQLEVAKEEYIRATIGIQKEQKILLPKLIEAYAKYSCSSSRSIVDMIQRHLP